MSRPDADEFDLAASIDELLDAYPEYDGDRFSLEAVVGSHERQRAFVFDQSRRIHVMCARQSGKTWGDVAILIDNALRKPNTTNIFLGLNSVAVRMNVWEPVTSRMFDRFDDLNRGWFNETRMLIRFPNGSRLIFGGYDDFRHIKNLLGGRLDGGVLVADEAQDASGVLDELLDVILPPMLTPSTRIILSGTIPDTPAGRFWEEGKNASWSKHNWGRLANVHTPEAREMLDLYLADTGLSEDDPQIQRDWFGRAVFDTTATAYRYLVERNGYVALAPAWLGELYEAQADVVRGHPLAFCHPMQMDKRSGARFGLMAARPLDGVVNFAFAIDPGSTSDRASIQGIGWGAQSHDVQHVFDWTTTRGARLTTGQIFAVAGVANRMFNTGRGGAILSWRYDAGSSQNTIDNLLTDYGLPLILAAKKTDLIGQVNRASDLLVQGRGKVMIGSALEQDLQRARWDRTALAKGQHKWASAHHPDPSEGWRYSLQDYYDAFVAPTPPTVFDDPLLKGMLKAAQFEMRGGDDKPNYS